MGLIPKRSLYDGHALQATHLQWWETIETQGVNLTVWEEEFIENVGPILKTGGTLTERQAQTLEDIYTKRVA